MRFIAAAASPLRLAVAFAMPLLPLDTAADAAMPPAIDDVAAEIHIREYEQHYFIINTLRRYALPLAYFT